MQDPETIAKVKMMRTLRDDMTDLNKDIASLVAKIDSMPAKTRDAILADLLNAKAERPRARRHEVAHANAGPCH
jgi:hypothetical protein